MRGAVWEWLHFRKFLTEIVAQRSIHNGSWKFYQICISLKMIQVGGCLKLHLTSRYPVLGINNHMRETTIPFSSAVGNKPRWEEGRGEGHAAVKITSLPISFALSPTLQYNLLDTLGDWKPFPAPFDLHNYWLLTEFPATSFQRHFGS